jgi:UMF1 family MFS transporter
VAKKPTNLEHRAWYLYDFGNSGYAAVILLAVYARYFQDAVVGGAEGTRLWGVAVGIAMLVVALVSPILGPVADFSGAKKSFLFGFTLIAVVFTAMLYFVQPGDIGLGMLFFIVAEIGYRGAQVFYNALLPEIAEEEELARVSGNGWAIGSLGGIVNLLLVLPPIVLIGGDMIIRLAFPITALFFAVSSIPLFRQVKERSQPLPLPEGESYLTIGFRRLSKTLRQARDFKEFIKFLVAFVIYNDGAITAFNFAAIIGGVLYGLEQQALIGLIILVSVTNAIGAWMFGVMAGRNGLKAALISSLILMIAAIGWLYFNESTSLFFAIAALAGMAIAGIQSVSRTMIGMLSPPGKAAEFYGLFALAGRSSSFIGPLIYGFIAGGVALRRTAEGMDPLLAEQIGQRAGILSIVVFLVVGLIALFFVNVKKGQQEAV